MYRVVVISIFVIYLFCSNAFAKDSYQFEFGLSGTGSDFSSWLDGYSKQVYFTGYFNDISLSKKLPDNEAAFWQRTSLLHVNVWDSKQLDMNEVRGGRILRKQSHNGGALTLLLASPGMPVWVQVDANYHSGYELKFVNEDVVKSSDQIFEAYTVGWFVKDNLNVDLRYYNYDDISSLRLWIDYLVAFENKSFLSLDFAYEKIEDDGAIKLSVQNGVIRNFDLYTAEKVKWKTNVNVFPQKNLKVYIGYAKSFYDTESVVLESYLMGTSYQFTSGLGASLDYWSVRGPYNTFVGQQNRSQNVRLGLSLRF